MKKLSLAVFNTQPPHLYFGGVERRIIEVSKRLSPQVNTTVYSATKNGFKTISQLDGTVLVPCFSTDLFFPLDNWVFNKTLSRISGTIRADVYEAHTVSGYGVLNNLKKRNASLPFIHTIHGVLADEYAQSYLNESLTFREKLANIAMWRLSRIEKECAEKAALIVTVSEYSSKKIVQLYNIDKAKIRVAPNGVDPQRFSPMTDSKQIKFKLGIKNRPCILFVGRLIPRKGLAFLIEAAKHIVAEKKDAVFVIVGSGPLKEHLMAQLKEASLSDNFTFLGDVSEDMLPAVYNCADLFAFPSIQEGQGIALLEAQATAKPVVAFSVGGVSEAVQDKETGFLVKPNSNEMAEAILKLLSDNSLREKMGRKGREFIRRKFSWDICASRMGTIYHDITD